MGGTPSHSDEFFENDRGLVEAVSRFVGSGIVGGAAVVIAATAEHRVAIESTLSDRGIDLGKVIAGGQVTFFDADETLPSLMTDGQPDPAKFRERIVPMLENLFARFGRIYVYGEMTSLLWHQGNAGAALALEKLWDDLIGTYQIRMLCGFRLDAFQPQQQPDSFLAAAFRTELRRRQQVEAAFRESEALKNLIIECSRDCIKVLDLDARLLFLSKGGIESLELDDPSSVIGVCYLDLWEGETRAKATEAFEAAKRGGSGEFVGFFPTMKNKLPKWWHIAVSPITDATGRVFRVLVISRDITDQMAAQEASQERERRLRELADAMPQIVWVISAEGKPLFVNRKWVEYTGIPAERALDIESWDLCTHPDDLPHLRRLSRESMASGEPFSAEVRVRNIHSDDYRWHLARGVPVKDASGKVTHLIGTSTYVHDQKLALFEVAKRERQLFSVLEMLPVGVGIAEPSGKVTLMNPRTKEIWGGEKPLESVRDYGQYQAWWHATGEPIGAEDWTLARALREKRPVLGDIVDIQCFDGSRKTVLVSATPIFHPDSRELLGGLFVLQDITAMKTSERALRDALHSRDEFLSIASHELKTPLTTLMLQTQSRQRAVANADLGKFTPDKLAALFAADEKQIRRLTRLVEDMLDVSRIQTGKLTLTREEFDLCELVRETTERLSSQLESQGCDITVRADCAAVGAWDRFRLEQVYINLLTNAAKYAAGKPVLVEVTTDGKQVRLEVTDRGMGIAEQDQARIFDQFERAVPGSSVSGMGLGLYISKKIIEAHQGTIRVRSRVGEGSTFTVELPLDPGLPSHIVF